MVHQFHDVTNTNDTAIITILFFFFFLVGSSSNFLLPENPAKEKAKDYDGIELKKPAGHQPSVHAPLKGNNTSFVDVFPMM